MKSNYVSVEGDTLFNEPEKQTINFLELKPSLNYELSERWMLRSEPFTMAVNWVDYRDLSYKSAVRLSGMITDRLGLWVQPEIPFGSNRTGYFNLKVSLFYRY